MVWDVPRGNGTGTGLWYPPGVWWDRGASPTRELWEGCQGDFCEPPCSTGGERFQGTGLWGKHVRRLRKAMACAPGLCGPPATNWLAPAGPQPQGLAQPHGKQC